MTKLSLELTELPANMRLRTHHASNIAATQPVTRDQLVNWEQESRLLGLTCTGPDADKLLQEVAEHLDKLGLLPADRC